MTITSAVNHKGCKHAMTKTFPVLQDKKHAIKAQADTTKQMA